MELFVGLDLGQVNDPSAIAVVEQQTPERIEERPIIKHDYLGHRYRATEVVHHALPSEYYVRILDRVLGASYPTIVQRVSKLMALPELKGKAKLVADHGGAGRPTVDLLRSAGLKPIAVTVHGGEAVTREGWEWKVPKRDIISTAQVLLQARRLRIAPELEDAETLKAEMENYRVKIDPVTAHDSYNAREGKHDDLIFALAIALWIGERPKPPTSTAVTCSFYVPLR
jgi:hypothetical protein